MASFSKFEEIIAWREARKLNLKLGKMIDEKRFKNNFRLITQIEGSAGSIMDNIAEGFERGGNKEFIQYLFIAKASCAELRSQLYRAIDRKYIEHAEHEMLRDLTINISKLIWKLINYLQNSEGQVLKFRRKENINELGTLNNE